MAVILLSLVALVVKMGPTWTSDEGAVRAQVEAISQLGTWALHRPYAGIDPEETISPIYASAIRGSQYYPYTKRPAYPMMLVPFRTWLGRDAVLLPSVIGSLLAAVMGALIAATFGVRYRNLTFWILVAGTPLLLYGFTVTAHTLATAACAFAVLLVIRIPERPILVSTLGGMSIFFATVLRAEAAVFGLALAIAVVSLQSFRSRRASSAFSLVVAAAAVLAHVGSTRAALSIAGVEPVSESAPLFDVFRIGSGFAWGLLVRPWDELVLSVAVLMCVGGAIAVAIMVHRSVGANAAIRSMAVVSVAGSVGIVLLSPSMITGLFAVVPILGAGLAIVNRELLRDQRAMFLLVTSLLFIGGVVVVQVGDAGGVAWGGRYLLPSVPLLVVVAVVALDQLPELNPEGRVIVGVVLAIATFALTAASLLMLREAHSRTDLFNDRMGSLALSSAHSVTDAPLIVSPFPHVGRHVWATIEDVDYVLAPEEDFEKYVRRLARVSPPRFGVFRAWDEEMNALFNSIGYRRDAESQAPFHVLVRTSG
jgi:hypothetical protein